MKKIILIVEDDSALRMMYSYKFESNGYTVHTAENGAVGLKKSEEHLPDMVLLDLRMPVMDGEEMLKKLREQYWGKNIRVIILTNISKREAPMSLSLLSVSRFIVKAHSTPGQVLHIVEEVLAL